MLIVPSICCRENAIRSISNSILALHKTNHCNSLFVKNKINKSVVRHNSVILETTKKTLFFLLVMWSYWLVSTNSCPLKLISTTHIVARLPSLQQVAAWELQARNKSLTLRRLWNFQYQCPPKKAHAQLIQLLFALVFVNRWIIEPSSNPPWQWGERRGGG